MTSQPTRIRQTIAVVAGVFIAAGVARSAESVPPQSATINEELSKTWKTAELKPSKKASDYEFVRRAFIDIVGRIPTAEEVRDFVEGDSGGNKRAKLIHRLLYDKEYKPKFAERTNPKDPKSVITYDYASEYATQLRQHLGRLVDDAGRRRRGLSRSD